METAQIVPLRVASPTALPRVRVEGDVIIVDRLRVQDRALAGFVEQRAADEHVELAERALRIGLLALQDAGTSVDVDLVRREFDALIERSVTLNERAAKELDQVMRANFGDQDGRLPRVLERFLGDRGQLHRFVSDLFDEHKRDSAIGRMRTLLGSYFDGDASRLAQLLDPTRLGSPMYQFRTEIGQAFEKLNDRMTAIEAAYSARGAERARSSAKGADFEDLLGDMLADAVRGTGDVIERTGVVTGDVIRSRKGDFLLTVDPQWCGGVELRVVIEAKDRQLSWRQIREELAAAKRNRGAAMALAVFTPAHAPAGVAPFDLRFGHVLCVVDPEQPDGPALNAAIRLARLHALVSLVASQTEIDATQVLVPVAAIRSDLEAVRSMKSQLTSIKGAVSEVAERLDRMRGQVLARVSEAESLLRPQSA